MAGSILWSTVCRLWTNTPPQSLVIGEPHLPTPLPLHPNYSALYHLSAISLARYHPPNDRTLGFTSTLFHSQ